MGRVLITKQMARQDYYSQFDELLNKVSELKEEKEKKFCAIVLMYDNDKKKARLWSYASPEQEQALLLLALRKDDKFACSVTNAVEARYNELKEMLDKQQNHNDNEEDNI